MSALPVRLDLGALAPAFSTRTVVLVCLLSVAAHAIGIWAYRSPYLYDDAMFFLRYAEHIAQGEGFRWNLGEPPVWGASAPIWPLLLAGLIRCGVAPETSVLVLSWVLSLSGAAILAVAALRCAGLSGAVWCILFESINSRYCNSVLSGMESPLAMFLVSCGIFVLTGPGAWWSVGTVAGLALAEKIDLAPFGLLVLAGAWLRTRQVPWRAALLAGLIGGAWYLFAYLHFGSVVPHSFVTKLHAGYGGMRRDWFLIIALLEGGRLAAVAGAVLALPALWRRKELLLVCVGLIGVMLAGYTLKPPAEDFGWYQAPVQPAVCFLGGVGLGWAMEVLMRAAAMPVAARMTVQVVSLAVLGFLAGRHDRPIAYWGMNVMAHTEADRSQAGKWIDAHTPKDARLITGFGHVSYYGRRYTYDFTFLNRLGPLRSMEEMVAEYRPEVMGYCMFRTGIPPEKYIPPAGYRLVKLFDSTYRDRIDDYYVVVLLRDDVPVVGEGS